jgi:hypothetical protein
MCIAFGIPKSKNTESEYVIIIAFPLEQWLHERSSVLCYTYIACLVKHIGDSRVRQTLFGMDIYQILCKVLATHNTFVYEEMVKCVVHETRPPQLFFREFWILECEQ